MYPNLSENDLTVPLGVQFSTSNPSKVLFQTYCPVTTT